MRLNNGILDSPFYIFIKPDTVLTDVEILNLLGIEKYTEIEKNKFQNGYVEGMDIFYITRVGEWMQIIDGCNYLWVDEQIRNKINVLGKSFEVMYCSIGDVDMSLEFVYYKEGKLRRKYILEDPNYSKYQLVVKEDFGLPLDREEDSLNNENNWDKIISLVKSIGIPLNHKKEDIKCYGIKSNLDLDFFFDENEY